MRGEISIDLSFHNRTSVSETTGHVEVCGHRASQFAFGPICFELRGRAVLFIDGTTFFFRDDLKIQIFE
ncbi:hypothetical protein WS84_09230 [Burkholderia anthina]|nr:hypothetical protein WS84_09230 [Burkholderia anthina]KVH14517.1 hypothetical protein WS85_08110 [Burkholderia anthina]KVM85380.1 hypothetical protein WT06_27765 [Burkholderia anthina]KVN52726.1 hypothetical protein WT13_29910 [Burkholderia anthina]KVX32662.1 hypothetical protein WT32_22225 [Burkholderia anthina]